MPDPTPGSGPPGGTRPPRVRFAPSPTGYFHVGSARTSLFNWLFARRNHGIFVLRIEDTDTERNREEWVDGIISAMSWLGMEPDEGPYRQSEHAARYAVATESLWENGFLYACDCTRADVEARHQEGTPPGYDGFCRDRGLPREGNALRFRTPDEGTTVVHDVIRGEVHFPHEAMEDFVVVKSNGQPLFVLANVVDDRDMGITHVIRGEDLLPTTPKAVLVWQALDSSSEGEAGWGEGTELPVFAHLPMLVNEQRKKLSKRRDPVAVESYRDEGYLPEAFVNFLALLGWSPPGHEEKVPVETCIEAFALEDVNHSPAFFDVVKFRHLNGEYIREMSPDQFVERSRPWVDPVEGEWAPAERRPPWSPEQFDPEAFRQLAPLVQERVAVLGEVPAMVDFVFLDEPDFDEASWRKAVANDEGAAELLAAAAEAYGTCEWTAEALREATETTGAALGRNLRKTQAPIRVAVTGRSVGPPLFESLAVLGRERVLRRLHGARERLEGGPAEGSAPAAD